MNKKKAWLLSISLATIVTANGLAMAAVTPQAEKNAASSKPQQTAGRADFCKKGDGSHFQQDRKALLEFLNIDEKTFDAEIKEGKTLAEIAKTHGIPEEKLKSFLVDQMTNRMNAAKKTANLSDDKKAQLRADMEKRVSDMINGKMPMKGHGPMGRAPFDHAKLLSLLNMDEQTLRADMQAGKSLAAIAKEHGVSEQSLKDLLLQDMYQKIDEDVAAGRIPADKAGEMKAHMEERVSDMINHTRPMGGHRPDCNR